MRVHARASKQAKEKWEVIIAKYQSSGLSIKKFAQREGYSASSVWAWKRRLVGLSKTKPVEVAQPPTVAGEPADVVSDSFLPLLVETHLPTSFPWAQAQEQRPASLASRQIQIRYPSGIELTITASAGDDAVVMASIRTLAELLQ